MPYLRDLSGGGGGGGGGGGAGTFKAKGSDETRTATTTLAADSDLVFDVVADSVYFFTFHILHTAHSTPDFKFTVDITGASNDLDFLVTADGNTTRAAGTSIAKTGTTGVNYLTVIQGMTNKIVTDGQVQFQWAQNGFSASATTVVAGSCGEVTAITPEA